MTLASTNGLENQRHISRPPAQLKRAGTLGVTDMQLLKNQDGQLERKANHAPIQFPSGGSRSNFQVSLVNVYIR